MPPISTRAAPLGLLLLIALLALPAPGLAQQEPSFGLPLDCRLGETCFVQQLPDMDPGAGTADPHCGVAAYDGHKGTDFRVLSMKEVEAGVPVVAMADGVVLRLRDGMPDRLVRTPQDRAGVAARECGNGLVVDHGGRLEVQYCHLRQGSLRVREGQSVKRGDALGEVGASGMAQFPHVHVTVRRAGREVDPSTGRPLTAGCNATGAPEGSLWAPEVRDAVRRAERQVLALGVAGGPVDHGTLPVAGPPPSAARNSAAIVGWGWVANLREGDRVAVELADPDGVVMSEQTTEPMDRAKADYSLFAGRRGAPKPGIYTVTLRILDGVHVLAERRETAQVE